MKEKLIVGQKVNYKSMEEINLNLERIDAETFQYDNSPVGKKNDGFSHIAVEDTFRATSKINYYGKVFYGGGYILPLRTHSKGRPALSHYYCLPRL